VTRTMRRAWSPQIAKAFLGAYFVLLTIGGGLLLLSQLSLGERITKVEHTVETKIEHRVELCSTAASCHHLLNELLATIRPSDIAKLRKRVGVARPRKVAPIARELAKRHAAVNHTPARHVPRPPPRTPPPAPRPAPSPPVAHIEPHPPAAPPRPIPSPPIPVPPVPVPAPEVPHVIEVPHNTEGPLGLPCVKAIGIEVLCHRAH
jgi:hypothetical protein